MESFLKSKWEDDTVKGCIKNMQGEGDALEVTSAVELVKSLIEKGSTNKGLKDLQGLIYKQGYENGELKAV